MSGKEMNFDGGKIKKSNFYKNKKLFNIYMTAVSKISTSKKEHYGKKSSFEYFGMSLDIMIIMLLDHYV